MNKTLKHQSNDLRQYRGGKLRYCFFILPFIQSWPYSFLHSTAHILQPTYIETDTYFPYNTVPFQPIMDYLPHEKPSDFARETNSFSWKMQTETVSFRVQKHRNGRAIPPTLSSICVVLLSHLTTSTEFLKNLLSLLLVTFFDRFRYIFEIFY